MTPRYAAKVDANQAEIVDALRQVGASVYPTFRVGHGFPDIVCGFGNQTFFLEVKTEQGKLTPDEAEFIDDWRGRPVAIVRTPEDALRAIGLSVND